MRDLGKPDPISETARDWLNGVKSSALGSDPKIVKTATELARLVKGERVGEIGSCIDLARPIELAEGEVVDAINRLIEAGLVELAWRPMQRASTRFRLCRPADRVEAATRGLLLSDATSVLISELARHCAAAGVHLDRKSGADLLDTISRLLRSRIAEATKNA